MRALLPSGAHLHSAFGAALRWLGLVVLLLGLGSAALVTPRQAQAAAPPTVKVEQGTVSGTVKHGVRRYLGIRYAVAERWAPPRPAPAWSGVRRGDRLGAKCAQRAAGGVVPESLAEDCLFVNVELPDRRSAEPRPVIVWIHGGGFAGGQGADPQKLAFAKNTGAVVVSVNYRVGALGFFALPGLRAERRALNFGLQDQQEALRWIQRNIEAFGGDPDRVTVFGESAGAISTCLLRLMPGSAGLLHRTIANSGECTMLVQPSVQSVEAAGSALAERLGCPAGPNQLACMRALPVAAVNRASVWDSNVIATAPVWPWVPVVDGATIPDDPQRMLARGEGVHVPAIVGSNHDEGRLHTAGLYHWKYLRTVTKADLQQLVAVESRGDAARQAALADAYLTPTNWHSRDSAYAAVITDGTYACPATEDAQAFSRHAPAWQFEFAGKVPLAELIDPVQNVGSFHGSELVYLFQEPLAPLPWVPLSASSQRLATTMARYWGAFAATGDPNAAGLPLWPQHTPERPAVQDLRPANTRPLPTGAFERRHFCDAWSVGGTRQGGLR